MSKLTPVSFKKFVKLLRKFGFEGPFSGGKHLFMLKEGIRLNIPNPHKREIGVDLLTRILRKAGIARETWIEKAS